MDFLQLYEKTLSATHLHIERNILNEWSTNEEIFIIEWKSSNPERKYSNLVLHWNNDVFIRLWKPYR